MAVTQTGRVVFQIEVQVGGALRTLGNIDRNTDRAARSLERLKDQARNAGIFLRNAFIGGSLFTGVTRLTRSFLEASDAAADLNAKIGAAAGGPQFAAVVLDDLFTVSQRLGVSLDSLGGTFQKLQAAVPTAALSQLTFSLETVSQILATTGSGAQATNAVLLQLSQGLGTGALRGDEFRSIFENAPQLLRAWAAALGRGEEALTTLRDEQAFTTESFIRLNGEIRRLAEESIGLTAPAQTVERAMQRIGNAILFAFAQDAGTGDTILTPFINALNALADITVPAVEIAFLALNAVLDGFNQLIDIGSGLVKSIIGDFRDLASQFVSTRDDFLPLVEDLELAFRVVLPTALESFLALSKLTIGSIINVISALVTSQIQGVLSLFDQAKIAYFEFRKVFATDSVAEEYDRQIAVLQNTTESRLERISSAWVKVGNDGISALNTIANAATNAENRALQLQFGRQFGGEDNLGLGGDLRLPGGLPGAAGSKTDRLKADNAAEREARRLEREAIELAQEMQRLRDEEQSSIEEAVRFQADFTRGLEERIRAEEDQITLLRASDADRDRLADQLRLEAEIRKLRADAIGTENEFLAQQIEITAKALEGAQGEALLGVQERRRREEDAKEAAEDQARAYERAFGNALGGVKQLFRDIFTEGASAVDDFGERLSKVLEGVIGSFIDSFLDATFDQLARSLAGSVTGSGGGGGFLGQLFGGLFGGGGGGGFQPSDYGSAPGLVGPPQPGAGGGGFAFSGLGFSLGALAGSLFSDSKTGTALTSTLDPLPDQNAAPQITIINNGNPLSVDSTSRRSNGDYQLIVSAAVNETRSVYERDLRRGYGGFAESLHRNTSADRTV